MDDFEVEGMDEAAIAAFPAIAVHDRGNGIAVMDLVIFKARGHNHLSV